MITLTMFPNYVNTSYSSVIDYAPINPPISSYIFFSCSLSDSANV